MLQRVMMDGIELPRLYIAENKSDAELAKSKGIPFIRWTQGQDMLIKMLLRPVLERMFPHIKWDSVLGRRRRFRTQVEVYEHKEIESPELLDVVDDLEDHTEEELEEELPVGSGVELERTEVTDEDDVIVETADHTEYERVFNTSVSNDMVVHQLDIQDYVGDMSSCVNIDVLQRLRLMPAFIGNILDCVKLNIGSGMYWSEGYNKRRDLAVGRYDSSRQKPNLIILDVSGSIPRGISATMISLIDTLRTQLSADLIITSSRSEFYPMGCELPSPQEIRDRFGYSNESYDFFYVLTKHIKGRHYGHVFSFGDNDTPDYLQFKKDTQFSLEGTTVEHVHHYHTGKYVQYNSEFGGDLKTGYAKWCHMLGRAPLEDYDTSWCKVIRE